MQWVTFGGGVEGQRCRLHRPFPQVRGRHEIGVFDGRFLRRTHEGNAHRLCRTLVYAVAPVVGYGRATITILDETFSEIPDSPCLDTTRVEAIDLIGRSDELVLDEAGTFCPPGRSGDSMRGRTATGILDAGGCFTRSTAARVPGSSPAPPVRGAIDSIALGAWASGGSSAGVRSPP